MGTRNLTAVVYENEYRAVKYCQWDGYLGSAGVGCLDFLKKGFKKSTFLRNLKKLPVATAEQVKKFWVDAGADPDSNMVTMDVSARFAKEHPTLQRDMPGYDFLRAIQSGKAGILPPSDIEFAKDSLFCEYCYVLNLDNDTFEIYAGFNKNPMDKSERFYAEKPNDGGYYPVRHLKTYKLSKLPASKTLVELDEKG